MDSVYNNTNFLPEGVRCNINNLQHYGPFTVSNEDPSQHEINCGTKCIENIKKILLKHSNIDYFCGSIFNYRIGKAESFIKNLYDFFRIILFKKIKFTYSPQYGINLWPGHLGYLKNETIENLMQDQLCVFFMDYIVETTTFLRYHIKCRYNDMFNNKFRKQYLLAVIQCLLIFGKKNNKLHIIKSCIENTLLLIQIDIVKKVH
tara:strand:- start:1379 stop:1990 length:612 start_codon:yes stop_codon:yes gene_type:complete